MNGFSRVCVVQGAGFFNDVIDGEKIDSGSVFILEGMDESNGRAKGQRTVEYKCPDSKVAEALVALNLPTELDVQFELITSKSRQVVKVVGFKSAAGAPNPRPMPKAA